MKSIRILLSISAACLALLMASGEAGALERSSLWNKMCASCHDGSTAPGKEALRDKYGTTDVFTEAVLRKGARCMNILKNDKKLIRKIAEEIGLTNLTEKQ